MESRDNTLKVGLVIAAAVIMGVLGYLVLQDVLIRGGTETYYADFPTVEGVEEGTPVRFRGQPIGRIVSFELRDGSTRAEFRTKRELKGTPLQLYPEYTFVITQDDLFGEKYVDVTDPVATVNELANRLIAILDTLRGSSPSEDLIVSDSKSLRVLSRELRSIIRTLDGLAQDPEQQERWTPVLSIVETACADLDSLALSMESPAGDAEQVKQTDDRRREALLSIKSARSVVVQASREMMDRTPVEPGFPFAGLNRAGLANMLAGAFTDTLDEAGISGVLEEVISVMGSETLQSSLEKFEETLTNVNELVLSVSDVVTGGEGLVTGSLANVYEMSENFKAMSEDLETISGELSGLAKDPEERQRWETIFANIEQTTTNLNELSASLGELAGDETLQADIKDSVRLTKETLEETKETVVRFQDTLDKVDETLESADSLMGTAEGTVVEAKDKLDQLDHVGDAIEIKMGLNIRAVDLDDDQALGNEDVYVGDLNAAIGYEDTYVYFGADDIGEDNNFNLMMGYGSLAGFSFRGGVYRGELGLGAAYYGDLGAELMWYDTEDPKVNAYGYIPLADRINLVVGGEDVGNDPMASVGVGVELQ